MNKPLPLAGKRIWVTRPREQAESLVRMIQEAGGEAILLPLIEIQEPPNPTRLEAITDRLDAYDMAIFISPTSAERGLAYVLARRSWPTDLAVAAIGQGTARALRLRGLANITAPTGQADSEALLAMPEMNQVDGKRIAIFRGEGGLGLLADSLRQRGATVDYAECYRRIKPEASQLSPPREHRLDAVDGIVITSSEALQNLIDLTPKARWLTLKQTPLFVPHDRIADAARKKGVEKVIVTESGDAGLLQGMVKFFQS